MKKILVSILVLACCGPALAFTDFYCISGAGTNTNSGWSTNSAADYTSLAGNWDGVNVFTPTDGSTPASNAAVTNGAWGSVFTNADSRTYYVARITNVAAGVNGAISFAQAPSNCIVPVSQNGALSLKVGGAWNGPSGAVGFPMTFFSGHFTNTAQEVPRMNMKGKFTVTAGFTIPFRDFIKTTCWLQGYTNTAGDFGQAEIEGSGTSANFTMLTLNCDNFVFADITWSSNGVTSGNNAMVSDSPSGGENMFLRCVFRGSRGKVTLFGAGSESIVFCEAYSNGLANVSGDYVFGMTAGGCRCYGTKIHDNYFSNIAGLRLDQTSTASRCIFARNGTGISSTADVSQQITACDFYDSISDHISFNAGAVDPLMAQVSDCNFFKSGGYAIKFPATATAHTGIFSGLRFGSGTQTNASGFCSDTNGITIADWGVYPTDQTPWADPTNGNFSLVNPLSKDTGYMPFLEINLHPPTNTVAYPDIGAAPHQDVPKASAFGQ